MNSNMNKSADVLLNNNNNNRSKIRLQIKEQPLLNSVKKRDFQLFTIQVDKHKGSSQLGFYVKQQSDGVFVISEIKSVHLNSSLKRLKINDEILRINESYVKGKSLDDVVALLSSLHSFKLTMKRFNDDASDEVRFYDVVNGKVDANYSHKLFLMNSEENDDDEEDGDDCRVRNLFNYYSNKTLDSKAETQQPVVDDSLLILNSKRSCSKAHVRFRSPPIVDYEPTMNFTSEEYNTWLRKKMARKLQKKSNEVLSFDIPPPLKLEIPDFENSGQQYAATIEQNQQAEATSLDLIKHYKNLLNLDDQRYTQVPKAIDKLTTKQNSCQLLNELEFKQDVNCEHKNSLKSLALFDGYLNLYIHHAYIDSVKLFSNEKNNFYAILRVDQQPHACTAVGSCSSNDANATSFSKFDFNEQFIVNLNSNKCFDFVICEQPRDTVEKSEGDDSIKIDRLFFSCKFDFNFIFQTKTQAKLCLYLKSYVKPSTSASHSIPLSTVTVDDNFSQIDAYFYVTINYLKEYSLIDQIFSSKLNSKLLTSTADDTNEDCKFNLVLRKLIHEVENRGGLHKAYLYQLNVCLSDIKWTLLQLERDNWEIIQKMPDIHAISNVLKELIRELPEPIFVDKDLHERLLCTWKQYKHETATAATSKCQKTAEIFQLIECLQPTNREIFSILIKHFKIVISYEAHNFMNAKKLARIFANLLFGVFNKNEPTKSTQLLNEEIFEYLLQNWESNKTVKSVKSEHGKHRVHFKT